MGSNLKYYEQLVLNGFLLIINNFSQRRKGAKKYSRIKKFFSLCLSFLAKSLFIKAYR
jgi:hypothetical protein